LKLIDDEGGRGPTRGVKLGGGKDDVELSLSRGVESGRGNFTLHEKKGKHLASTAGISLSGGGG